MLVASSIQTGLLDDLLGVVTTTVSTTASSLVKVVGSLLYDPDRIVIVMEDDTKAVLQAAANGDTGVWTEEQRIQNVESIVTALQLHARRSQGPVIRLLSLLGVQFESHWISNTIEVSDAPVGLAESILALVGVKEIIYDVIIDLETASPQLTANTLSNTDAATWGATKIEATSVWATNNTGQGIIVGTIDSGVRHTHETLQSNWVGAYGWYDPAEKTAIPFDPNGHGTHTVATIVGGKGVGVAPGAKWMTCKGCKAAACPLTILMACAQFMLCPTDTNGKNCDPTKAPHIVNNSWGVGQGLSYFQPSLDAWAAARILSVFAAGNTGATGCRTVVSPGDMADTFSVGATDASDVIGSFSSLGPSVNGRIKPDFTAPGVRIRSAWNGSDSDYLLMSGSSMAAPHLSGTIALALSVRPGLNFDSMRTILINSTERALPKANRICGGTADTTFPNNQYGYGRINAQKVVKAALAY
uniref:subtilisin n=1 Tax=Hyaloperonospora arabidopsidis (strain Emoy2) TaxID=559515 RepID=M4C0V4_HYAAE